MGPLLYPQLQHSFVEMNENFVCESYYFLMFEMMICDNTNINWLLTYYA